VHLDESSAECDVFTFKEGILSAVAHDLRIRVTRFSIETDGATFVKGTFEPRSLRVMCARRGEIDDPRALSDDDKRTIEGNIVREVLGPSEITFASSDVAREEGRVRVRGDLTIAGRTRSIAFTTRAEEGREIAEVTIHQPDFGITPYRAMLGTLRVQADVRVRVAAKLA
jgi:hypothetical protein